MSKGDVSMKTCVEMLAVSVFCVIGATAMAADKPGENANKGEKRAEKIAERKEARDVKHDAKMVEWQKRHDAFIAKLTARLANTKKLTDAEKAEIMAFNEQQYQENVAYRSGQHEENMKFLDTLTGDTTAEQIKAQVKAHFAKQKGENQEHRATQQGERKAEHEKIKVQKQDGSGAANP